MDLTHRGKSDGSASTYILQIVESEMTENSIKICNKEIPFNKSFYELCDKVIEYGNEKYGVKEYPSRLTRGSRSALVQVFRTQREG